MERLKLTQKRMSLYFNLEDNEDRLMWEYINSRKKSQYIKRLILNDINGLDKPILHNIGKQQEIEDRTSISEYESVKVDIDDDISEFPEDLI